MNSVKKRVDVYYYIEIGDDQDIVILEKCLRVFLDVHKSDFYIDKFINCESLEDRIKSHDIKDKDVIKRGLVTFNNMTRGLKLKSTNDAWFIYISSGNINKLYENVFIILLNTEPLTKRCYYVINKKQLKINDNFTKSEKLETLKLFNTSLKELFGSNKTITYSNLEE